MNAALNLESILARVVSDFKLMGVRYALIGGFAVTIRAEPRLTRDIDFAVSVTSDQDAETIVRTMQQKGYLVDSLIEQTSVNRLSTARLSLEAASEAGAVIDLLFASSGIEPETISQAELIEIQPDLIVPVARTEHLIAMKVLSLSDRRPRDLEDLIGLLKDFDDARLNEVKVLLKLITSRGFNRGKHLEQELAKILKIARA